MKEGEIWMDLFVHFIPVSEGRPLRDSSLSDEACYLLCNDSNLVQYMESKGETKKGAAKIRGNKREE